MIHAASSNRSSALASGRWQLWIDRGGGYDILQGDRFTIGGSCSSDLADIAVRCRWGRRVATLNRAAYGDVICWETGDNDSSTLPLDIDQELRIEEAMDESVPRLRYRRPCPLSGSAVVTVRPPHRLLRSVDAAVLLDQTLLLGPEPFNHVCVPALSTQGWVLFLRGGQWWIRGHSVTPEPIALANRWQYQDWSLMIRES
jgi:hypothetical protein